MADYLRDGAAIYQRSFAIIRAETDLSAFSAAEASVAVRMIHACGLTEVSKHIVFGAGLVGAAESKDALMTHSGGIPYLVVRGRQGGSAMVSAAVNALARPDT